MTASLRAESAAAFLEYAATIRALPGIRPSLAELVIAIQAAATGHTYLLTSSGDVAAAPTPAAPRPEESAGAGVTPQHPRAGFPCKAVR